MRLCDVLRTAIENEAGIVSEWTQQVNSLRRHVDYLASIPPEEPFYSKRIKRQKEEAAACDETLLELLKQHELMTEKAVRNVVGMSYGRVYDSLRRLEAEGKARKMKTATANYWRAI